MFNFLKDKLKGAISKFSKSAEEEAKEEEVEVKKKVAKPAPVKKKEPVKKAEPKPEEKEEIVEEPEEELQVEEKVEERDLEKKPEKRGFFGKISDRFFHKEEEKAEPAPEEKEEPAIEEKKEEEEMIDKVAKQKEVDHKKAKKEKEEELAEEIEEEPEAEEILEEVEEDIETKKAEEEAIVQDEEIQVTEEVAEETEEPVEEEPETEEDLAKKAIDEQKEIEEYEELLKEDEEVEEKSGFFSFIKEKIVAKKISQKQFDELFWEIELAMLENNVAVEVTDKIKSDLAERLVDKPIPRGKVQDVILLTLKKSIAGLFNIPKINILTEAGKKKPYVICFVGVNGSGKTTTIAKVAKYFINNNHTVVLAAADTFRAAAIDQLQHHADKLGVKCIKHDYGSDAAAVAFDAVKHAEQTKKDVVLIDTAGRLHSNVNLMEELKKVVRVAKPDLTLFIGESITGNDCVEQAKQFSKAVQIDGIVLSKADIDEKGGAAISISYVTKKPIVFIGTGQEYEDLKEFDPRIVVQSLGL